MLRILSLLMYELLNEKELRGIDTFATGTRQGLKIASFDNVEYSIVKRDTTKPDIYTREECLEMMSKIRVSEQAMNWKCPGIMPVEEP